MFVLYNFLLTLLSPIWVPWMLWRTRRRKLQPDWKQRTGDYAIGPPKGDRRIWIHAVSVGEVIGAIPILEAIRELDPTIVIVLTVSTSSGHQTAEKFPDGAYDHLFYFPIDVARFQLAAMVRVQPKVVAIMETELWMNFLWAAKSLEAQTMVVNGRISDRSFKRSRLIRFFYRALFRFVDTALVQSELDAERFRELGAKNVSVFGNTKFDQANTSEENSLEEWRKQLQIPLDASVIVIGSTRGADEEEFVSKAMALVPNAAAIYWIWAPRHLERANALSDTLQSQFGSVARRSLGETGHALLLDTYGELDAIYSVADLVIVGGAFGDYGGQNLIQPLAKGKPVLHGVHMSNFREAAAGAACSGATQICPTIEHLANTIQRLLSDSGARLEMGRNAQEFVSKHRGAARRYAQAIVDAANDHDKR